MHKAGYNPGNIQKYFGFGHPDKSCFNHIKSVLMIFFKKKVDGHKHVRKCLFNFLIIYIFKKKV